MANRDNRLRKSNFSPESNSETSANDPVYRGEDYAPGVRSEIADKTVGGHFQKNESVTARAYENKNGAAAANDARNQGENARNDERYFDTQQTQKNEERAISAQIERAERVNALSQRLHQRRQGPRMSGRASGAVAGLKSTRAFMGTSVLWILGVAYLWQLLFAVISLLGFGIHAYILDTQSNTWWGKVSSVFVDFTKVVPGEYLGYAFYGLNFILVASIFILLLLSYYLIDGISVLATTSSTLIAASCFALSIMPVTNLLPWLLLWAVYMQFMKIKLAASSLFSTA